MMLLFQSHICDSTLLGSVQRWSDQSDSTLQDCFDHVDWDMFRIASDIDVYTDLVSEFILMAAFAQN